MRTILLVLVLLLAMLLTSCAKKPPQTLTVYQPVEVRVPVPVKPEPPAELLTPLKMPLPVFVAPSDPLASSALTVESERLLRGLIEELLQRIKAWQTWASTP